MAKRWRVGTLDVVEPDGRRWTAGRGEPIATLEVHDFDFFPAILMGGEIGVGDAYVDELWDCDDLAGLLEIGIRNREGLRLNRSVLAQPLGVSRRLWRLSRRNSRSGSRRNIAAHYDLSNDFFRLWLDETLTYSCALFRSADESLADAQVNKLEAICQKALLAPGQRVLEIGCGWGSFALHAAKEHGVFVTALTISEAQRALASQRVDAAGLAGQVTVQSEDYRDARGQFDRIVSIEMLEAVGLDHLGTFFRTCERLLRPGGVMVVQTIAVPDRMFAAQRDGVNWIQLRVFPGSALPSIGAIERAVSRTSFQIRDVADIGSHYPETLRCWRETFQARETAVHALGFNRRFIRTWEYYLASCEASFRAQNTLDLQIVFERAR